MRIMCVSIKWLNKHAHKNREMNMMMKTCHSYQDIIVCHIFILRPLHPSLILKKTTFLCLVLKTPAVNSKRGWSSEITPIDPTQKKQSQRKFSGLTTHWTNSNPAETEKKESVQTSGQDLRVKPCRESMRKQWRAKGESGGAVSCLGGWNSTYLLWQQVLFCISISWL